MARSCGEIKTDHTHYVDGVQSTSTGTSPDPVRERGGGGSNWVNFFVRTGCCACTPACVFTMCVHACACMCVCARACMHQCVYVYRPSRPRYTQKQRKDACVSRIIDCLLARPQATCSSTEYEQSPTQWIRRVYNKTLHPNPAPRRKPRATSRPRALKCVFMSLAPRQAEGGGNGRGRGVVCACVPDPCKSWTLYLEMCECVSL